jgi:RNA polymerase sigma-70 factor (ECF subfamily)
MSEKASPGAGDVSRASRDEDLRLVRGILAGEGAAFEELFHRHRERVYRVAFRYTRNRDDALDLLQEVFVKAYRALKDFDGRASFATWITRIAMNAGVDRIRRGKAEVVEYRDDLANPGGGEAPLRGPGCNPAQDALRRELGDQIREAVARLSEKHRSVFLLHAVDGLSYREIADTLGIAIGTVMSRLHYARRYLRDHLEGYLGQDGEAARQEGRR